MITHMSDLQDVSVKVPADRLGEFYEWFGRWMRQPSPPEPPNSNVELTAWDPDTDYELAVAAWRTLPLRARLVLGTLIDHPDRRYTGDELASLHDIPNGKYGLAGALAWPGRRMRKLGRTLPIQVDNNPSGGSLYWMTPRIARLWGKARDRADDPKDQSDGP